MTRMMGLQRTDGNLMFLYALFLAALSVGNVLDNSYFFFMGYLFPASVLAYPMTFLVTSTICELWEEKYASRLVLLGLSIKFLGVVLLGLSQLIKIFPDYGARKELWSILGTSFWEVSGHMVLGRTLRFWTSSMITFPVAQFVGIWVFCKVMERHIQKAGSAWGGRWSRYLAGALAGEITEVMLFMTLTFASEWTDLFGHKYQQACLQQIYVRLWLTFLSLPVYYALTWRRKQFWRRIDHV